MVKLYSDVLAGIMRDSTCSAAGELASPSVEGSSNGEPPSRTSA